MKNYIKEGQNLLFFRYLKKRRIKDLMLLNLLFCIPGLFFTG